MTLLPAPRAEKLDAGALGSRRAAGVEPPEQAVLRVQRARLADLVDPRLRDDAPLAPHAAAVRRAGRSARDRAWTSTIRRPSASRRAPTGMRRPSIVAHALRYGSHVHVDDAPIGSITSRLQHLVERLAKDVEEREAQTVHADVVVFPQRARRPHRARRALSRVAELALADVAVVIDRVRLVPQRALPLAGLLQEMTPRDVAVLRATRSRRRAR